MVVLSTDGLTEARDAEGSFLEAAGAMRWIAEEGTDPSHVATRLIERARARSRNAMRDDVAVLAIAVQRQSEIAPKRNSETGATDSNVEAVPGA